MNHKQLQANAVGAQETYLIWSRRTGKTDGFLAPWSSDNVFAMPGSLGGFLAPSFRKMLTQFMASLITGWRRVGYIEGRDYSIGKPNRKWDMPIHAPQEWSTAIHWRCGSAITLMSQDRPGSANGNTLYWLGADEARFLKREALEEEVLPALSGNPPLFGHLSCHKSIAMASDRPRTPASRWLLQKKELMDLETVQCILQIQLEVQLLQQSLREGGLSEESKRVYMSRIRSFQSTLNELRRGLVYYSEASTLDNIDVVGPEYLLAQKQLLSDPEFRISIMNKDLDYVEGGFYPDLDDEVHAYVPPPASYTTSLDLGNRDKLDELTCRHDADRVDALPLRIAGDYGSSFNCFVVGQVIGSDLRFIKNFYVRGPLKVSDALRLLTDYYRAHKCKDIYYHYDHTAIAKDGKDDDTYADIVVRGLRKAGYNVIPVYMGQAPDHRWKYELWGKVLRARAGSGDSTVSFNRDNCQELLTSLQLADVKQTRRGFEKNKDLERDKDVDQVLTTHLSDAADQLLWGVHNVGEENHGVPSGQI